MHEIIKKRLEAECFGARSIEVYGGVYHLVLLNGDEVKPRDIINEINIAVRNAKDWTPEVSPGKVARNVCHLLFVDPALIELACGMRFV